MFSPADSQGTARAPCRPAPPRDLRPLFVVIAAALFFVAACAGRPDPAHLTVPVDTGTVGDPALVQATEQTSWQAANVTREFVVRVELENLNPMPVEVRAAAGPGHPGFDRMVVAILAGPLGSGTPDLDTIKSAVTLPVTLNENQVATLTIAEHLLCQGSTAQPDEVPIMVDGQMTTITMPAIEGDNWAAAMATILC